MRLRFPMLLLQALAGCIFLPVLASAGQVRISFLTDNGALEDTLEILKSAGCPEKARESFAKAVGRYNRAKFPFDYRRFPASTNGFYSFDSMPRLVSALPFKLSETAHSSDLNCFDLAILVAGGALRTSVATNQVCGPFMVGHSPEPGKMFMTVVETPAQAFELLYPNWAREVTKEAFPPSLYDTRVTLSAALFRFHNFTVTNEQTLTDGVLEMLRASWKPCGVKFPKRFELVLGHEIDLPKRQAATGHAGLLFPQSKGYIYLEKSATTGPFVRLDMDDKKDVCVWFTGAFKGAGRFGWTHYFATFNDTEIQKFTVSE